MANTKQAGLAPHEQPLTHNDLKALSWAVGEAGAWRGALTGNPDPGPLKAFDNQLKKAKAALKKVRELKGQGL